MTTKEDRPPLSIEVSRLEGEVGPHALYPQLHFRLFEQLKQRNVFRVAVLDRAIVAVVIGAPVSIITVNRR